MAAALLFVACVALKLNGSSVGRWQKVLREPEPIRGLLFSTPKKIRSDEWVVWTPSMFSQARHTPPFPIENSNLGYGRAPLLMSVPVAYYTTFFRPQLWGFFLFDFERGFSFYWCAKVFGLALASVWLFRQLGIRSRGIIAFGAVWVFFSSYVQWWFSTPPMLPEMVASWAICLGCVVAFWQEASRWRLALAVVGFVLFGINFILCIYPPFQIPLLFLGLAVLVGLWLERRKSDQPFRTRRGLLLVAASSAAILLVLVPFLIETWPTLQALAQTEYPGRRHNTGGNWSVWKLFAGPIGFFESEDKVPLDFPNICEASNFYPLWPLVLLGLAAGRVRFRISVSPLMVMLTVILVGLSLYCVVRLPEWLLQATLLAHVHEDRALLSIGIADILLVCLFLDRYRQPIFGKYWALCGALAAALGIGAQLIKATGATVLNGTKFVPDLPFLRQLDTKGAYETIYNRYAWIICAVQVFPEEVSFSLLQPEFYRIHLPPNLPILRDANYRYYVFPGVWRDAFLHDFSLEATTPSNKICIYRRNDRP
jgi:hypothetical protein